jgi:hypothetical protein
LTSRRHRYRERRIALLHNAKKSQVTKIYQQDLATRTHNLVQMQPIAQRVLQEVPGTVLAQDSPGCQTDNSFDLSEFHKLSQTQIQQVLELLKQEGLTATLSSIHINAWFGAHNKWHGAQWVFKEMKGRDCMPKMNRPPQSMEEPDRLKRDNKTKASKNQRLSQKSGWVMPLNNFEEKNINPLF